MSGTVNIARSIFDHAVFADEPMTEREAWIWLIMEASWKARTRRVGSVVVNTERGQVAASVRFLAGAWKWTAPKVQRYLKRLEKMEMIRSQADTGVTVLTICNYDEYQNVAKASDTAAIQQRYSADTNEKKDEIREEGKEDANASIVHPTRDAGPSFSDFWAAWPLTRTAKKNAEAAFRKLSAKDRGAAVGRAVEWASDWRQRHPTASDIHPATYLNKRRWEDEPNSQPALTIIHGANHDRQSPRYSREAAASDALARRLDAAARTH